MARLIMIIRIAQIRRHKNRAENNATIYLKKGIVACLLLCFVSAYGMEPISSGVKGTAYSISQYPDDKNFWSAINVSDDGTIYIGVSGKHGNSAHLYAFYPSNNTLIDLGSVEDAIGFNEHGHTHAKIHTKPFEGNDGQIYFGTHLDFWINHASLMEDDAFQGGYWMGYNPATKKIKSYGKAIRTNGLLTAALDHVHQKIYALSWPNGHLLIFDLADKTTIDRGRVSNWRQMSRALVVDSMSNIYWSVWPNKVGQYRFQDDTIHELNILLPDKGEPHGDIMHPEWNRVWSAAVWSQRSRKIYGIQGSKNILFELDPVNPEGGSIRSLAQIGAVVKGNWHTYGPSLSLALGNDDRLYYTSLDQKGFSHLFIFDLDGYNLSHKGPIVTEDGYKLQ